jgi:hypothetical protein
VLVVLREAVSTLMSFLSSVIPASFLKKPRGGSSLGSLCGGSRCCLYSTRERGGCGILFAFSFLRSLM